MMYYKEVVFSIFLMMSSAHIYGQNNQIYSGAYTNELNGPGYFAPLADVVGANLSAQSFSTHYKSGFGIHFGIISVRSLITEGQKSHAGISTGLDDNRELSVPTIFGRPGAVITEDATGNVFGFPGGFGLSTVSFLLPQVTVSTPVQTDVSFRFFAHDFVGEFGSLSLIGGGLRHHLHPYFKLDDKLHLSIGYSYNQLNADSDIVNFVIHTGFTEVGYKVNRLFVPYVNVQYIDSSLSIDYIREEVVTSFTGSGNDNIRAEVGFSFRLNPLLIKAGYHVVGTQGFSALVGLSF